jgi:formylmethanofuran dehydrogenase subunit C
MGGAASNTCAITINGGNIMVNAEGDGIDSNGSLLITGGTVVVHGPATRGNNALDTDGRMLINGGVVLAGGNAMMSQAPNQESTQPCLAITFRSAKAAGSVFTVKDSAGATVAEYRSVKAVQYLVLSTPAIKTGVSYSIYVDNASVGTVRLSSVVTGVTL